MRTTVSLVSATAASTITTTNSHGDFEFDGLSASTYSLRTTASGFAPFGLDGIVIRPEEVKNIEIQLEIAAKQEHVQVRDEDSGVSVGSSENSSAIVLKGQDLDSLSDDPDELQAELEALAGPSSGPNGGQIYIDGFSNGRLPPKSSIREVRVNRSPFSAEYDKAGQGRIEVFTKPGTDQFHGLWMFMPTNSGLSSVNPFLHSTEGRPEYFSRGYVGDISGPVSKKASVALSFTRHNNEDEAVINAQDSVDYRLSQSVPVLRVSTHVSPRLDYQLSRNNTLMVRYQYLHGDDRSSGIGQLVERSHGLDGESAENNIQISDTQVLGAHAVNESRLQFSRARAVWSAVDDSVGIVVLGAVTRGGNPMARSADLTNNLEVQNYTAVSLGKHFIKFGGRVRSNRESNMTVNNPGGSFTFDSLTSATPSQFTIVSGRPLIDLSYADAGLYVQDEWTLRRNLNVSYGVRYETQTSLNSKKDFAPRVGLAWGVGRGKTASTVLRVGWGVFYDRVAQDQILQAKKISETGQQEYVIKDAGCLAAYPEPPALGCAAAPTVYSLGPRLVSPYTSQVAASWERQLGKVGRLAITFLKSRGVHQIYLDNVNAPLDAGEPVLSRPDPAKGNVYQYQSEGTFKQSQLIVNGSVRAGKRLSLNAFYSLNYAKSNFSSVNGEPGFASDQYSLKADYGRASFDVRQRVFLSGTMALPWSLRVSPYVVASSGQPYNITVSQDLNGDSIYNDRPGLTSAATGFRSPCGGGLYLDPNPKAGEKIVPMNCASGAALVVANLKISKAFRIGKKSASSAQDSKFGAGAAGSSTTTQPTSVGSAGLAMSGGRYTLAFGATIHNLLNRVNPAAPIGVVGSPLFGKSIALADGVFSSPMTAANRTIGFGVRFEF